MARESEKRPGGGRRKRTVIGFGRVDDRGAPRKMRLYTVSGTGRLDVIDFQSVPVHPVAVSTVQPIPTKKSGSSSCWLFAIVRVSADWMRNVRRGALPMLLLKKG